jgi:hypothetical protein
MFQCGVHQKLPCLPLDLNQFVASMAFGPSHRPGSSNYSWHAFCIYIVMQANAALSSGIPVRWWLNKAA